MIIFLSNGPTAPVACSFCNASVPTVDEAIIAGWIPTYLDGDEEVDEVVCPKCIARRLTWDASEEFYRIKE